MPWCPVCHAEYRAGVKVCRQCQAELVRTPPRAGEHYVPPARNLSDTATEKLAQSGRLHAWGRQFVDGFRLFGESFRLMLRMRNAWLVLAVLTGLATVAVLRPPRPVDSATLARMRETGGSVIASIGYHATAEWLDPVAAVGHVRRGLETQLTTPLWYFSWLYGWFSFGHYPSGAATRTPGAWHDPRLWAGWLALTVLGALFTAGMLRWVQAAARREEQTAARFWESVRQSFWPLLAWVLAYAVVWYGLAWPTRYVSHVELRLALLVVAGLLLLPLVLTSKVIVVLHAPVYRAPVVSARVFAKYLLVILGFALPFIVLHDLVRAVDGALHFRYYSVSDPQYAYRYAMPVLAFVLQVAKVAVELTITTAFVILVARWGEEQRSEAASA